MHLTDTHCHLQDARLANTLSDVLARAREVGVTRFVCCGTSEADWEDVQCLATREEGIFPMLGLHPWHVDKATHGWDRRLLDLLQTSSIGVGECGLDFTVSEANQDTQVAALETQWRIALELNRPLSLHCRKAFDSLFEMAKKLGLPQAGAVIHAFSGSAEQAACAIRQGFYLSFACSLMNPKNQRARKALKVVPIECLLLETDSPDISPTPGVNNEPANLVQLLCITAELLGEATETLEKQLQDNVDKVFFRG